MSDPSARQAQASKQESTLLADELLRFKETHHSFEGLARLLRRWPEFDSVNRTTIIRWVEAARSDHIPKRALAALDILRGNARWRDMSVALVKSPWLLPAQLLTHPNYDPAMNLERAGVKLRNILVDGGSRAAEMLRNGEVHLAGMAIELTRNLPDHCKVLCSITHGELVGFATKPISSTSDLGGLNLAYQTNSIIGIRINELMRGSNVPVGTLLAYDISRAEAVVRLLQIRKIDGVVGWEPYIGSVKRKFEELPKRSGKTKASLQVTPFPRNLFGSIEMVLAVNLQQVDARALREFVRALVQSVHILEQNKTRLKANQVLAATIASGLRVTESEIRDLTFFVRLEPETILNVWDADVRTLQRSVNAHLR